ncbi:MAG TPA: prepilin-type N-terminal cleavage/methylation domain-containing protein [Candidatus Dormibacteraeota bacterium]
MRTRLEHYSTSQGGYTLVELIVASAIGLLVMTGLTSVVLTTWQAGTVATSRIEASSQIRNFQFEAYDDFALSGVPAISSCTSGDLPPCTIALSGLKASNSTPPVPVPYQVKYTWDGANLDRQIGSSSNHAATNVTAFSAYMSGTAPYQTVVVTLTVTVQSYAETQTLRFHPRVNS